VSYNNIGDISEKTNISKIPIQIPIILPEDISVNKHIKSFGYMDPDVYDYQLHALLIKPSIAPNDIEKFSDLAIVTSNMIGKNFTSDTLKLDMFSQLKIACAMCRLDLKSELSGNILLNVKDDLRDMFGEYRDIYYDTMKKAGIKSGGKLSMRADQVYNTMLDLDRVSKEMGNYWLSYDRLKAITTMDDFILKMSLTELNNNGLILQQKNFTEFCIFDLSKINPHE
jgi:hypothetical protein